MRSARSATASAADGIDSTRDATATGSMALPSSWSARADGVASAGASVISWPQLRASASRLCLAGPVLSVVAVSSWMIMSLPLLGWRVQQLADLLDRVGPAELGGVGQAGAE